MIDDRLSIAARALKSTTDATPDSSARTRARIMMSLHQRRYRGTRRTAWLVPIGIAVAASTAWAGSDGRIANLVHAVTQRLAPETAMQDPETGAPVRRAPIRRAKEGALRASQSEVATASPPPAETVASEAMSAAEPPPALARTRTKQHRAASDSVNAAMPRPDEPGFEAYVAAHHAHFAERNPAAALPAWDAYLREAPSGRFSSEARYNRALCLVRLGRYSEAEAALTPFARGDYGKYRQREATELLAALKE